MLKAVETDENRDPEGTSQILLNCLMRLVSNPWKSGSCPCPDLSGHGVLGEVVIRAFPSCMVVTRRQRDFIICITSGLRREGKEAEVPGPSSRCTCTMTERGLVVSCLVSRSAAG